MAQEVKPEIKQKIQEVYQNRTDQILNNPTQKNYFVNLLEHRIKVLEQPEVSNEKYPKLSSVALNNKLNPDLKRDESFDPTTFNPLKYDLKFTSTTKEVYRIDNTNYIVLILPQ